MGEQGHLLSRWYLSWKDVLGPNRRAELRVRGALDEVGGVSRGQIMQGFVGHN